MYINIVLTIIALELFGIILQNGTNINNNIQVFVVIKKLIEKVISALKEKE